ncbi:uncharacterized protein [Haliotis asinina]|uniref:uncharacterized protein n=1 Tax=Haliotis asinina TaxID=109174 RepID=UPI0035325015
MDGAMNDSGSSRIQTRSSAQTITDIPQHVAEPTHSCTAEILAVFWGSTGVFLLLAVAAVIMHRNGIFSSAGKKKKRGLDTLFEVEEVPAPTRPPSRQESSYAEVMSTDTACHYRRISRSMGSINFRPFKGTIKGSTLYNTTRSKMNTQAAVDITISVVPPDFKGYTQSSYWLGTKADFDEVYECLSKTGSTPRFIEGLRHDIVPQPDEEDTLSEEPQGATGIQTQRNTRLVPSKFLYISPVFNVETEQSDI